VLCKKCGYENKDSGELCQKCGASLKEGVSLENTMVFEPVMIEEKEIKVKKKVPQEGAILVVKKGPNSGRKFLLSKDKITVGRSLGSDIFLDDITVSRKHAEIDFGNEEAILHDMGSLNGTYVNGELVDKVKLKNNDEVQIGRFKFIFLN